MNPMDFPSEQALLDLVRCYATLRARVRDELAAGPLVLPNGDFFPDTFTKDQPGLERVLARLQRHSGTQDIPVRVRIPDTDLAGAALGAGCNTCGPGAVEAVNVTDQQANWLIELPHSYLLDPIRMTSSLATALSHIFLQETLDSEVRLPFAPAVAVELGAVALGFGALLLEGSYMYTKACGGPRVTQLTQLSVGELAAACAFFLASESPSRQAWSAASGALSPTQRALLSQAKDWVERSPRLFQTLHHHPEALVEGPLELDPPQAWWKRLTGSRKARVQDDEAVFEAALSGDRAAVEQGRELRENRRVPGRLSAERQAELRALVAEAFPER